MLALAAFQVKLVDDSGLNWSDLLTPALTFFGALGGVVLGGLIARRNLFDIEERRAAQDRSMEDWRQAKEDAAEKRRVRGIARALSTELQERQSLVVACAGHRMWWPPGRAAALPIADDDRTLLGVWLRDDVWDALSHARELLASLDHEYPSEPPQARNHGSGDDRLDASLVPVDRPREVPCGRNRDRGGASRAQRRDREVDGRVGSRTRAV